MVRFLHSADWQLGMTRHFFSEEAEARFRHDRIEVLDRMRVAAEERGCSFAVVAGDVFETNQVDRTTVMRAMEGLARFRIPVFLLPGNHDPLDAGSVYRSAPFAEAAPAHVHVLDGEAAHRPVPEVEIVGAPWRSKRPLEDAASAAALVRDPRPGVFRVLVAHGQADELVPETSDPALMRVGALEEAIAAGRLHYAALGDRHSPARLGTSGRIWYAGAPEPTAYREEDPGHVLVVDLSPEEARVERVRVGRWRFVDIEHELAGEADLEALVERIEDIGDKARAVVRLRLSGAIALSVRDALERYLEGVEARVAALERPPRHQDLHIRPAADDFRDLPLRGYAVAARDRLQEQVAAGGDEGERAADALALLLRLAKARSGAG